MAVSPDAVVMPARPDRITIRVIAVITALLGVALATAQVSRAVWMLTSPEVTVNLLANGATPVASDAAVSASIDTVAVTTDLVASSRVLFAVGAIMLALTAIIVALAVTWLLWSISSEMRFPVALHRFTFAAGFALVLGPLIGTAAQGFGSMEAAHTTNDALGGILLVGFGVDGWGFAVPLVGFAVLALGYVFQAMRRMQRDTEGLNIGLVFAALVWDARRRRVGSVLLDVTGAVARIWVALVVVGAVFGLISLVVSPTTSITDVPITTAWPSALPCQSSGGTMPSATALYCGTIDSASLQVAGLGADVRSLIFVGGLLAYVTAATPGVLVSVPCRIAAAGRPFARRAPRWLLTSAVVVLIGGTASEVLLSIARYLTSHEVLPDASSGAAISAPVTFQLIIPIWPIGCALGLAALAVIFRYGSRMQRDTEGLV